jgi:cysteine desulfurase
MMPYFTDLWGTPVAPHQKGQELFPALTDSFKALYQFIGAKEADQFVLTSSGAEAVNHVISSVYREVTLMTGKNQFITSNVDEAPAMMAIHRLQPLGCIAKTVKANSQGLITAEALAETFTPRTALVSLSWGNGLTGVIQPVTEIANLCRERGVLLHLDATHVLGKLFYEIEEVGADFITFNGDQLHAPKGTGGLYIKQGVKWAPFIVGGAEQGNQRAGSFNMPGLVGLASAAEEALEARDFICTEIARLRDKLEMGILSQMTKAIPFFKQQERLPHCTTIGFPGIANEALLFTLNRRGICASIGGGQFQQISLLLTACGVDQSLAYSAIAFSLSRYTTEEEVDQAILLIVETVRSLLKLSKDIYPQL